MKTGTTLKKLIPALLPAVLLCLVASAATAGNAGIGALTPQAFKAAIDRHQGDPDVVLLDIRTPGEFAAGHIKGARLIDYYGRDYIDRLKALDRQKTYLIYCRSGNRTGRSLAIFKQLGFTRVFHLQSGLIGWTGENFPLVSEPAS